jgi:dTDP-4-dehydrorhamnose 3,5-epimerase
LNLLPTSIPGCYRVRLERFDDARGYFERAFDLASLRTVDPTFEIVQVNRSLTLAKGVIRGLHFQRPPHAQSKLVTCLAGAIFDVCVDLRRESATYRSWVGFELTPEGRELMLIPSGCAHGFQALTDHSLVEYCVTNPYSPADEGGYRHDDPAFGIEWPLSCTQTSEKDAAWAAFAS